MRCALLRALRAEIKTFRSVSREHFHCFIHWVTSWLAAPIDCDLVSLFYGHLGSKLRDYGRQNCGAKCTIGLLRQGPAKGQAAGILHPPTANTFLTHPNFGKVRPRNLGEVDRRRRGRILLTRNIFNSRNFLYPFSLRHLGSITLIRAFTHIGPCWGQRWR